MGDVMAVRLPEKRALFWGLGIVVVLVLVNVAWAQICSALTHCFSAF
jgi:hypothetical protein